jgi:hypothetical protein
MDLKDSDYEDEKRIRLCQDKVQWRAFVNTEMNLQVP